MIYTRVRFKPIKVAQMNTVNTIISIILKREENFLNMHDSCLEIKFIVSDNTGDIFGNDAKLRKLTIVY